jgi:ABC-2 type transport system ATP-binding protein
MGDFASTSLAPPPGRSDGRPLRLVEPQPGRASGDRAVVVEQLAKRFGDLAAVDGISFEVVRGETFGFLGPNGAGKSTTISMLCTLLRPSAGRAWVAGADVVTERQKVRGRIGLVFQDPTLDEYLTAEENLRFHGEMYGVPKSQLEERLRQILEMVELWDRRKEVVQNFSGGMRRRLEIGRGLLHSPRVLFLDEPTIGLDPQTRAHIWTYIETLRRAEDITIFLTTHYMDEAEHCDRIGIIDAGRIVAIDSPDTLKQSVGRDRVEINVAEDPGVAIARLRERFGVEPSVSEGAVAIYVMNGEEFVPRLFAESGLEIRSVRLARPTLDDVFMSYTGRTIRDAEGSAASHLRTNPRMLARRRSR